jgi:acyl-CoA synthetase (AMP-forming)/AMP-acid ligase II
MSDAETPSKSASTPSAAPCRRPRSASSPPKPARRCPVGQQGEVCVRGYALMKGYDGDPEGTAKVIKAGRLAPHRRPRRHARRRLHPHHRPLPRRHHSRRRKHLSPRGRGVPLHPSQGRRGAGRRHPQRPPRRNRRAPGSACGPASNATEEEIANSARARSPTTRSPSTSASWTEFPATLSGKIQKYKIREFEIEARVKLAAEFVRQSVAASLAPHRQKMNHEAFGAWHDFAEDGLAYQERLRTEW